MSTSLATVALVGALGMSSNAMAATPSQARAATVASAETANVDASARKCVKALKWYSANNNRYVRVKNSCSHRVCFKVDVPSSRDPKFTAQARKTKNHRYIGGLWFQGRKIYQVGC
ncbi:hypothetical protein RCO28_06245 [Streptomyces sp. LHD-70]|uniref:hypothetical protein n=1 Tax=Streptomyces sp. LHD-70 TaxID=3072140 RepID=UPI00280CEF41|nr:hypothetical protein [Streptomyces sp. LHD-70]MDQ8702093.1 hypothetical protein [Streptomyces sp. LHD-70]